MNFERRLRRLNEDSYWSPLPRIYDIERVSMAGTIDDMQGLRPGREYAHQAVRVEQFQHGRRRRNER